MSKLNIEKTVLNTIESHALFAKGDTLIVGFSGGADSTALLHLLHSLPGYGLKLIAAHLNHSLRGKESDEDELFCQKTCRDLGIGFESLKVDVKAVAESERVNLEDAGRQVRGRFFDTIKQKYCAIGTAIAHHADDQTETVLMRFLRGSGMTGLSGMGYINQRGYIRPLLDIPATELRFWLKNRNIQWREDSSNSDTNFLRNRIRHQLIPLLETYNPAIRETINSTAEIIAIDNDGLNQQTLETYAKICTVSASSLSCRINDLISLHQSLARRVIRLMYKQISGSCNGFAKPHCSDILTICHSSRANASINLPNQITAYKEYATLTLSKQPFEQTTHSETTISGTGTWQLQDGSRVIVTAAEEKESADDKNIVIIDISALPFPWHVRTFRAGDRMQPSGMTGHKKLKDLFIDLKIPRSIRTVTPLFFAGDELFWVGGIRLSALATVRDNTKSTIQISLIQNGGETE